MECHIFRDPVLGDHGGTADSPAGVIEDNGVAIGVDDAAAPAADIALDGQGALKFHTTGKDAAVPDGILESSAVKVSVAAVDGHIVVCTAPEIGKGAADGGAGHTDIGIESFLIT